MTAADLLSAALDHSRSGRGVIPVNGKVATVKWERFQTHRPSEAELRRFAWVKATGLAVILGPVSGNLCCRDFDEVEAYRRWAGKYSEWATTLPTSRTARGYHVFFIGAADLRTVDLGDGELRGGGGYCLLPPSLHPSGVRYTWLVPLPTGDIQDIDPAAAGLDRAWHCTESEGPTVQSGQSGQSCTERTEAVAPTPRKTCGGRRGRCCRQAALAQHTAHGSTIAGGSRQTETSGTENRRTHGTA